MQANVIIAATYANTKAESTVLSKELIYAALQQVGPQYPELGTTTFCRPSETKSGQHRRWSAFLQQINLDDHVKFINIPAEEEAQGLTATLERYHNLWFEPSIKPAWQLVVANGRHLLFVYDHYITDGRGGTYILESILDALNSPKQELVNSSILEFTTDIKGFPEVDPIKRAPAPLSLFQAILNYLRFWAILLLYRKKHLFFHDVVIKDLKLDYNNPQKEANLVKTRLHSLRLDASTIQKCAQACRAHQTTFTSLLHTLIKVTLAADFYPQAKFNHSTTVVDIRSYLKPHDREKTMETAASIVSSWDWLPQFRQAGEQTASKDNTAFEANLLWELARKHRAHVLNDMNHRKTCFTAWQSVDLLGQDEEDYITGFIPGLKLCQRNAFSLSNLGAFRPNQSVGQDGRNADWTITNLEFSAGAYKTGYAANLVFNVAGVQDGPTTVHVCYEEGALSDDFVDSVLERIKMRMDAII
ncbi:uncharacterized protein N7473_008066 [Penicillium subrubescens]|uniref:Alcohol acetyltransferase FCK4 n=1 Tax=Penicillium subrubescens TaxID=1316194 RepID=A0A1Q5TFD3_9EURO|nr:uncharacterized protein N7473_008066 [Penicillium subrubescens]KAJ5891838.1 hypothetical protein N7473_008066 [Penicillium subrubescens]OKO98943.1 hypothetical protein PENSUB_8860 [Penicillium subrubescens]